MAYKSLINSFEALKKNFSTSETILKEISLLAEAFTYEWITDELRDKQTIKKKDVFYTPDLSESCLRLYEKNKFSFTKSSSPGRPKSRFLYNVSLNEIKAEYEKIKKIIKVELSSTLKLREYNRRKDAETNLIKKLLKDFKVPVELDKDKIEKFNFSTASEFAASILCLKYEVSRNTFFKYINI